MPKKKKRATLASPKVTAYPKAYAVRFRDPGRFERMRTPAWATRAASSVAPGTSVTMGRTPSGNWLVQSVRVPRRGRTKTEAKAAAKRVAKKVGK